MLSQVDGSQSQFSISSSIDGFLLPDTSNAFVKYGYLKGLAKKEQKAAMVFIAITKPPTDLQSCPKLRMSV